MAFDNKPVIKTHFQMLGNDGVLPLSQRSIFYIGTGKTKMLAM